MSAEIPLDRDRATELLARHFAGELTPVETEELYALAPHADAARAALEPDVATDVDAAWVAVRDRLHVVTLDAAGVGDVVARPRYLAQRGMRPFGRHAGRRGVTAAAVATLALVVVGAVAMLHSGAPGTSPLAANDAYGRTYRTRAGQLANLSLGDGTRVTLAPNSTLRLSRNMGAAGGVRAVSLIGEAVFDVAERRAAPFVVRTGGVTTRVLGTRFAVRRYSADVPTRVVVVSGKVEVSVMTQAAGHNVQPIVVAAGTIVSVTDSTTSTVSSPDAERYTEWTRGALVFRGTPVPEALEALGDWYGYSFRIVDPAIGGGHLHGTFSDETGPQMLRTLETLLHVTATFDDSAATNGGKRPVIILRLRGAARTKAPARRESRDSLMPSKEFGR